MTEQESRVSIPEIGPTVRQQYNVLLRAESIPADPEARIPIGLLTPDDRDYQRFIARGIPPHHIASGSLLRRELRQAGFAFINNFHLDGNTRRSEKPIIAATIPLEGEAVDLGAFSFLTQEELTGVTAFQQQHPERFASRDVSGETIRKDMLSLLLGHAFLGVSPPLSGPVNALRVSIKPDHYDFWDRRLIAAYKKHVLYAGLQLYGFADWDRRYEADAAFMQTYFSDIYPWTEEDAHKKNEQPPVRSARRNGLKIEQRVGALQGQPSPFLDSGFRFGINPDEYLAIDGLGTRRINMVVFHLLSRGLSQMGRGEIDQQYITLGEYVDTLYPRDRQQRQAIYDQEERHYAYGVHTPSDHQYIVAISQRVLRLAREWAHEEGTFMAKTALYMRERRGYAEPNDELPGHQLW